MYLFYRLQLIVTICTMHCLLLKYVKFSNYRYAATKMQNRGVRSSSHELWQRVKIIIGWYKSFESPLNYQIYSIKLSNSYIMGCPPVRGDNPRALASGLSYVQVDKHFITILYHLQCKSV